MTLTVVWNIIGWVGGLLAYATLTVIAIGIWRGTQQKAGRTSGKAPGWLRSPLYYILTTVCFLFFSIIFGSRCHWIHPLIQCLSLLIIGICALLSGYNARTMGTPYPWENVSAISQFWCFAQYRPHTGHPWTIRFRSPSHVSWHHCALHWEPCCCTIPGRHWRMRFSRLFWHFAPGGRIRL